MNPTNQEQYKKFFIGGTGRSGTTILAKILGLHSEIFTFPKEVRFITDPDGLLNLKNALVDNWSYFQSDVAMDRFLQLMVALSKKSVGKYPTIGLSKVVGASFYQEWLNSFIREFVQFKFKSNWAGRTNAIRKIVGKYVNNGIAQSIFPNSYYCPSVTSDEFYSKINVLLSKFFKQSATNNDKIHTIEHTPSNIIHADSLYNIFPDFKLIHIYRDPRDVISSYSGKEWGSDSQKQNLLWIQDILTRWEFIKDTIPENCYYELAFEELIENTEKEIDSICSFLEVEFDEGVLELDLTRHNIGRWRNDLNTNLLSSIENSNIKKKYFYQIT